jgi:hypothetical protein
MPEISLAPEAESIVPAAASELSAEPNAPAALADCTPEQQVETRYMAALKALVDDALEQRHVEILVDALTWNLARIGYGFGVPAVADIVRRFGAHVGDIAQRETAAREAAEAKKSGHAPH